MKTALLGSLSNDNGDVKENGKKAIGLDWQNNNFARASQLFVHFFAVTARLGREIAGLVSRFVEGVNTRQRVSFLIQSFRIQPQKKLPIFNELNEME